MNNINGKALLQKQLTEKEPFSWLQKRVVCIVIALLGLLLILVVMTINVVKYETHLATGDTVLLALAPVDPRGFMQGDYMTLSYALENEVFALLDKRANDDSRNARNMSNDGYAIVALDKNNVGQFVRLAKSNQPNTLAANEMAIHYRVRNGSMKLATNAFFFQEGHVEAFEAAEYGLFRVNKKGEPLLTDMVNGTFEVIVGKSSLEDKTLN